MLLQLIYVLCCCITTLYAGSLRHLYVTWEQDPSHSLALHIHGIDTAQELTIYYDTQPHHSACAEYPYTAVVKGGKGPVKGRLLYHLSLNSLQPDSSYYFTVAEGLRPLCSEQCVQTVAAHPPYRIVEAGDWENTPIAAQLAEIAFSYQPDAVWLGGDYPSGVCGHKDYEAWDTWLDSFTEAMYAQTHRLVPLVMAIGNHEVVSGKNTHQAPFYFPYFRPTGTSYFSLPVGKEVHLFVLDSGHMASHGGAQKQWLEQQLAAAEATPIKIALYHVPLYPSVRFTEKNKIYRLCAQILDFFHVPKGGQRLFSLSSILGQQHWRDLFDTYHLTTAFEHHDQALKRTKCLRGDLFDPEGTLYLGDGGFGPVRQVPPLKGYLDRKMAKTKGNCPFFWLVDILPEALVYHAISLDHREIDSYTQPRSLAKASLFFNEQ